MKKWLHIEIFSERYTIAESQIRIMFGDFIETEDEYIFQELGKNIPSPYKKKYKKEDCEIDKNSVYKIAKSSRCKLLYPENLPNIEQVSYSNHIFIPFQLLENDEFCLWHIGAFKNQKHGFLDFKECM